MDENSNDLFTKANLILEAIVVPDEPSLDSLPSAHREVLKSAASKSFYLWSTQVSWYDPSKAMGMLTMPGIILPNTDEDALPAGPIIRFYVQ